MLPVTEIVHREFLVTDAFVAEVRNRF